MPGPDSNPTAAGPVDVALEREIKQLIVEALMLEDKRPEDIDTDAPLFGEGASR